MSFLNVPIWFPNLIGLFIRLRFISLQRQAICQFRLQHKNHSVSYIDGIYHV